MNALSFLMVFMLFAPVSAMVVLNLMTYRDSRYVRQPRAPMAPAGEMAAVMQLPVQAYELQRAYELRRAA